MKQTAQTLPLPVPEGLKLATADAVPALSRVYARAFANDPVRQWLMGPRRANGAAGIQFSAAVVRIGLSEGFVLTNQDQDALLILTPPRPASSSFLGLVQVILSLGIDTRKAIWLKKEMQRLAPAEPHWKASVLATDPTGQCQGKATALLQFALAVTKETNERLWLESSNPINDPFYERMGLSEVGKLALPNRHSLSLRSSSPPP